MLLPDQIKNSKMQGHDETGVQKRERQGRAKMRGVQVEATKATAVEFDAAQSDQGPISSLQNFASGVQGVVIGRLFAV